MTTRRTLAERLGDGVRGLRLLRGLTQAELAEAADMTSDEVSRVERGVREPRFQTLERLADALGVDVPQLFETPAPEVRTALPSRWQPLMRTLDEMPDNVAEAFVDAARTLARALVKSENRSRRPRPV